MEEAEFETWLASNEINLGEYKDQLSGFTIELFCCYPDKQSFKSELVDEITLKNKLIDPPKFYRAYDAAKKLSKQQSNGMENFISIQMKSKMIFFFFPSLVFSFLVQGCFFRVLSPHMLVMKWYWILLM